MSDLRVWEVTLHTEDRLVARALADVDATEEVLRELALRKSDDGEVCWETVYAETSAMMLDASEAQA